MRYLTTISLLIACVFAGAIADGLNERGKKDLGHPVEALEKVLMLLTGVLSGTWLIIISYAAFRISLFDTVKNIAKGNHIFYLGNSNVWDRFLRKIPVHGVTFTRVIFLAFAIGFTIIEF